VTATASGIVFSSDHDGTFMAVDSTTGNVLYTYETGGNVFGPPTTYMIGDRQWVFLPSALTATAFALPLAPGAR